MNKQSIVSPEDQRVTFVELFFDLVFVFSVTQTVRLLHHDLDWTHVGQSVLVFWMVWWAWTQFTWSLNAADTTNRWVELGALSATGVAFFMAVSLPDAFEDRALWFAIPYGLVRVIGLGLYIWVASADPEQRAAVQKFSAVSLGGLIAVLLGAVVGGSAQYWLWGLAIALDVIAAAIGGREEGWNLHPEHFSERHGLFVIIALGETLIITAGGVTGAELTGELIAIGVLAVGITCGLWWSYFTRSKLALDHALESCRGSIQSMMARDVYSLMHFPMIFGVIAYAVAIEEVVAHPNATLPIEGRIALAAGLALFVGGMAPAMWRATKRLLLPRMALIALTAILIIAIADIDPLITLAIAFTGVAAVAVAEERTGDAISEADSAI
jgi:low temperature requirement protein LtrA